MPRQKNFHDQLSIKSVPNGCLNVDTRGYAVWSNLERHEYSSMRDGEFIAQICSECGSVQFSNRKRTVYPEYGAEEPMYFTITFKQNGDELRLFKDLTTDDFELINFNYPSELIEGTLGTPTLVMMCTPSRALFMLVRNNTLFTVLFDVKTSEYRIINDLKLMNTELQINNMLILTDNSNNRLLYKYSDEDIDPTVELKLVPLNIPTFSRLLPCLNAYCVGFRKYYSNRTNLILVDEFGNIVNLMEMFFELHSLELDKYISFAIISRSSIRLEIIFFSEKESLYVCIDKGVMTTVSGTMLCEMFTKAIPIDLKCDFIYRPTWFGQNIDRRAGKVQFFNRSELIYRLPRSKPVQYLNDGVFSLEYGGTIHYLDFCNNKIVSVNDKEATTRYGSLKSWYVYADGTITYLKHVGGEFEKRQWCNGEDIVVEMPRRQGMLFGIVHDHALVYNNGHLLQVEPNFYLGNYVLGMAPEGAYCIRLDECERNTLAISTKDDLIIAMVDDDGRPITTHCVDEMTDAKLKLCPWFIPNTNLQLFIITQQSVREGFFEHVYCMDWDQEEPLESYYVLRTNSTAFTRWVSFDSIIAGGMLLTFSVKDDVITARDVCEFDFKGIQETRYTDECSIIKHADHCFEKRAIVCTTIDLTDPINITETSKEYHIPTLLASADIDQIIY
ncbi:hypothetical protein PCE1_002950 [Barthelona sp. PCE]